MERATRRGNYESGSDYVLEYGELRFSFNEADFSQRVEQAAVKLDFTNPGLAPEELHDLVELAVNGEIRESASALGEHVNANWIELVDIVFDERTNTFGYIQPDRDHEPIELSREPSWRTLAYRR